MTSLNFFFLLLFGSTIILFITQMHFMFWRNSTNVSRTDQNKGTMLADEDGKEDTCVIPLLTYVEQFFQFGKKKKHCRNLVGFGGKKIRSGKVKKYIEGEKLVCMDKEYNIKPGNCTVLSFGISKDWSFDDAMDKFGCKVFSFDPTIGLKDHQRSANIQFFSLGLSSTRMMINLPFLDGLFPVDRYQTILEMVNLVDQEIDYLKIDIEGSEVNFFKDVFETSPHLLKNVKQIGMEVHTERASPLEEKVSDSGLMIHLWNGFHQLECMGFKLMSYEKNIALRNSYMWRHRNESICYEAVWGRIPT